MDFTLIIQAVGLQNKQKMNIVNGKWKKYPKIPKS